MDSIVEIRVPTYRRPNLLYRALASVVSQTYPYWNCIVLDDDVQNSEAEHVCNKFDDNRIIHTKNQRNLGAGANIDQAFSLPWKYTSKFSCILEDDNMYLPDFLESNLQIMQTFKVDIVLRNQFVETPNFHAGTSRIGPATTYDGQYISGMATQAELWGSFFYSTAANNSSLFWRLGCGLDFSTSDMSSDPVFQERLRTLCIDRPVYLAMEPKIVWRYNGEESTRPRPTGWRWNLGQLKAADRERTLYRKLYGWLQYRDLMHHVWQSRFRKIDARAARVFERVGIRVPACSSLPARARIAIGVKRHIGEIVSRVAPEPENYVLLDDRIWPITRAERLTLQRIPE